MSKTWSSLSVLLIMNFVMTGCLKTRAQLREEGEDHDGPRPVQVQPAQDVQPQGRYVIDEIKEEMTHIVGRVEDLERAQKEHGKVVSAEDYKKLEDKVVALEQSLNGVQETLKKLQESPALVNPNELYEKAKTQYSEKDYAAAAESFGSYLRTSKPKHLEEATYLKAESYFHVKEYKKAIVEYSKFPEKFTKSSHMPDALYKIGQCFEALGMKEDARGFYQELAEKYPKSPEAKKVKKKVK